MTALNDSAFENVIYPTPGLKFAFQTTAGIFGVINLYLFLSLFIYEKYIGKKPRNGKILRLLCMLASGTSFLHELLIQFMVVYSSRNDDFCFGFMNAKSTLYNATVSFTYAFLWLRQQMFYTSPQLHKLRGRWLTTLTWIVLAILIIDPCVMFGFQFEGDLYSVVNNTCLVLNKPVLSQLPYIIVAFSYGFIQVAMIFLYFYPLHKRKFSQNPTNHRPSDVHLSSHGGESERYSHSSITKKERKPSESAPASAKDRKISVLSIPKQSGARSTSRVRSLEQRIRRWVILSVICVLSDLASATIIALFLLIMTPSSVITPSFLWHDISMLISNFCMVGCFRDFSIMVFPYVKILQKGISNTRM